MAVLSYLSCCRLSQALCLVLGLRGPGRRNLARDSRSRRELSSCPGALDEALLPSVSLGPGLVGGRVSACSLLSARSLGQGPAQRAQGMCE